MALCTQPTGAAVFELRIRAYNATGELDIRRDPFTLGTRVLLTCDATGLPEGNVVVNYRWYRDCSDVPNPRCEIRDRDPYYRVVSDTLLVDVTSWDQGVRYHCFVRFSVTPLSGIPTPIITLAGQCMKQKCYEE